MLRECAGQAKLLFLRQAQRLIYDVCVAQAQALIAVAVGNLSNPITFHVSRMAFHRFFPNPFTMPFIHSTLLRAFSSVPLHSRSPRLFREPLRSQIWIPAVVPQHPNPDALPADVIQEVV